MTNKTAMNKIISIANQAGGPFASPITKYIVRILLTAESINTKESNYRASDMISRWFGHEGRALEVALRRVADYPLPDRWRITHYSGARGAFALEAAPVGAASSFEEAVKQLLENEKDAGMKDRAEKMLLRQPTWGEAPDNRDLVVPMLNGRQEERIVVNHLVHVLDPMTWTDDEGNPYFVTAYHITPVTPAPDDDSGGETEGYRRRSRR